MKKLFATLLAISTLACATLGIAACGENYDADHIITVGASATPHAEILEVIKDDLKEQGYKLEIKVFADYITPNFALSDGSIDANYFQHTPYLNDFNLNYGTDLVSVGKIHYEPFGVYGKHVSQSDFDTNKTGRIILIPNDGSNLTRALFVLQDEGYITLKAGVTPASTLTVQDIVESNGNTVNPVQAETVATQLLEQKDGTIAVINGNYALQGGFSSSEALAVEDDSGDAAQFYANIIAVQAGKENSEKTKVLLAALKTQEVYDFIDANYNGAVRPAFKP